MRRGHLLVVPVLLCLAASPAAAQYPEVPALDGDSRISIQGGWRYVSNNTLYDSYYSREGNEALTRAPASRGGPLGVATFAYSATDLVEVGIDLFGTVQRLELTGQPRLTTAAYGALVGLRFQGWLDIGPHGLVPFLGILTGPLLAVAAFEGQPLKETLSQAWSGTAGANLRLSPRWGIIAEYRLVFARGAVESGGQRLGSFNAGGSWFSLGVTYSFPSEPSRPFDRPL